MLRFSLSVMRMERIEDEDIRGTHVQRRDCQYVGRMLRLELPDSRSRGRREMKIVGVGEEGVQPLQRKSRKERRTCT